MTKQEIVQEWKNGAHIQVQWESGVWTDYPDYEDWLGERQVKLFPRECLVRIKPERTLTITEYSAEEHNANMEAAKELIEREGEGK